MTRLDAGLSGVECAKRAGMSPTQWSRWETGEIRRKNGQFSQPRKETLEAIAAGLEVPLDRVLEAAGLTERASLDYRLARRLEPILARAPAHKRRQLEDALEHLARTLVETAA